MARSTVAIVIIFAVLLLAPARAAGTDSTGDATPRDAPACVTASIDERPPGATNATTFSGQAYGARVNVGPAGVLTVFATPSSCVKSETTPELHPSLRIQFRDASIERTLP